MRAVRSSVSIVLMCGLLVLPGAPSVAQLPDSIPLPLDSEAPVAPGNSEAAVHGLPAVAGVLSVTPAGDREAVAAVRRVEEIAVYGAPIGELGPRVLSPTVRELTLPDGRQIREFFTDETFYRADDETWQPLDTALVASPDGGHLVPWRMPEGVLSIVRSMHPGAPVVDVGVDEGRRYAVRFVDARRVEATVGGVDEPAVFAGGLSGGRDVEVAALLRGFKDTVVLPSRLAPSTHEIVVSVPPGVTARPLNSEERDAGVAFVTSDGVVEATYRAGPVRDAARELGGVGTVSTARVSLVEQIGAEVRLRIGVDAEWLAHPGRTFPVRIDPTWTLTTGHPLQCTEIYDVNGCDTHTTERYPGAQQWDHQLLQAGSDGGRADPNGAACTSASTANCSRQRAFVSFPIEAENVVGEIVEDASLRLKSDDNFGTTNFEVRRLLAPPRGTTSWSTQPAATDVGMATTGVFSAHVQHLDATEIVQAWATGSAEMHGLEVRAEDERQRDDRRHFLSAEANTGTSYKPALVVEYNAAPYLPGTRHPLSGTEVDNPVTLGARYADPDLDPGRLQFLVRWADGTPGDVASGWTDEVGHSTHVDWIPPTLPSGDLRWRVRAEDQHGQRSAWSSWWDLTVSGAPSVPLDPVAAWEATSETHRPKHSLGELAYLTTVYEDPDGDLGTIQVEVTRPDGSIGNHFNWLLEHGRFLPEASEYIVRFFGGAG